MPWLERFEPSITNSPFDRNPHFASSRSIRSCRLASASGVNLLKSGAIRVG